MEFGIEKAFLKLLYKITIFFSVSVETENTSSSQSDQKVILLNWSKQWTYSNKEVNTHFLESL